MGRTHLAPPAPAPRHRRPRASGGPRHVRPLISQRAGGFALEVRLGGVAGVAPAADHFISVDGARADGEVDAAAIAAELRRALRNGERSGWGWAGRFRCAPAHLRSLVHVAFTSGAEPTLCPNFPEAIEAVVHERARNRPAFFKIALLTNTAGFCRSDVRRAVRLLTAADEIWVSLCGGTDPYVARVFGVRDAMSVARAVANVAASAGPVPVVVDSLFPAADGAGPPEEEVSAYVAAVSELRASGVRIERVQIYSAATMPRWSHLALSELSAIARRVRREVGVPAEAY